MGLVLTTLKSQGLVASRELAIFATKSSRRDHDLVPETSLTNLNWFEFVGLVAGTKSWSLRLDSEAKMVSSHDAIGPCDLLQGLVASSHDATNPCDLLQGLLVARTSPTVRADLKNKHPH